MQQGNIYIQRLTGNGLFDLANAKTQHWICTKQLPRCFDYENDIRVKYAIYEIRMLCAKLMPHVYKQWNNHTLKSRKFGIGEVRTLLMT